jgi:hypothetical protein
LVTLLISTYEAAQPSHLRYFRGVTLLMCLGIAAGFVCHLLDVPYWVLGVEFWEIVLFLFFWVRHSTGTRYPGQRAASVRKPPRSGGHCCKWALTSGSCAAPIARL